MFDFPTSPTTGQISNGYQWDSEKWTGGSGAATPVTEQFFNVAGLTNCDIPVPTWAAAVELDIIANIPTTSGNYLAMQCSTDGSTFLAGSSYTIGGPVHNSGSAGYAANVSTTSAFLQLSVSTNQLDNPILANVFLNVTKPSANYYNLRSFAKSYDSAASAAHRTAWQWGSLGTATTAIKILRVLLANGGAFAAGSSIKVKWLGDYAQIPTGNAIADAPADNVIYRRQNNLWVPPQSGEILGSASGQYTGYGSGAATPIVLITLNYTVKTAGSKIILWGAMAAGAAVVANNYAAAYFQPSLQLGYSVYTSPTATSVIFTLPVATMHTHGQPAGTVLSYTLRGWTTTGTIYFGGSNGGAQAGMNSSLILQEVMP